jgi:CARDB protein
LSFLDQTDEPVRRRRRRPPGGPSVDRQTLLIRRTLAVVAGLIVLILLVLGIRGCLDARKEEAMQNYVTDANELVRQSNSGGRRLFRVLQGPGGQDQAVNTENALNGERVASSGLVDQARDLDAPDELSTAQRYLVETLELRRDGVAGIANAVPQALADQERRQSTQRVSQMMRVFSASDVIYRVRYLPNVERALEEEEVAAEEPVQSQFLPDTEWLDPSFVADQVAGIRSGGGDDDQAAAPGLHGNGLGTVTLGGVALVPGGSATVPLTGDLAFEVQVSNQGENTETDVPVRVTVGDATSAEETIDEIAAGETETVSIPLDEQPPTGENVPVEVEVEPVPGEEMTDNNTGDFTVIFTS